MKVTLLAVAVAALAVGFTRPATGAATVVGPKCPSHAPALSPRGAPSTHFVRPRARLVRLCRYSSVNWADSQRLLRQRLIRNGRTITSLTRAFNALKEPPRGIFCVQDDGREILLVFAYAGSRSERVAVKLSGCRFALNGGAARSTTPRLQHRLLNLVKGS